MQSKREDIEVVAETPEVTVRCTQWGDMIIETGDVRQTMDVAPLFVGLPDNRCQCPHWGYVLKGQITFNYADRTEIYKAGEVYYAPPGHTPVMGEGLSYVEFSPPAPYAQTMEVAERNLAAMMGSH